MSYFLPHLPSGWHVDEAIKSEEDRVVVIRFGHDWDTQCMKMDETLYGVAEKVQNFAVIYLVDITQVPDFNKVIPLLLCFIFDLIKFADVWTVRSLHCDVLLSVSSVTPHLHERITQDAIVSNKHIMIDLGTGNNNKMLVFSCCATLLFLTLYFPETGLWITSRKYVFLFLVFQHSCWSSGGRWSISLRPFIVVPLRVVVLLYPRKVAHLHLWDELSLTLSADYSTRYRYWSIVKLGHLWWTPLPMYHHRWIASLVPLTKARTNSLCRQL